jgi:glycosyltransferase involved in cell wall biosynthesis
VRVIRPTKKGWFTGAVNQGIMAAGNDDILMLNQDVWFDDDRWINFLEENSQKYDLIGEKSGSHPVWTNGYIHGTFMYIKRAVIDAIGSMDEEFFPLWGSTCEYQLRACRAGFKAFPSSDIPGFVHQRTVDKERYGSSITEFLNRGTVNRWRFMRTPPLISVVINTYNYGKFLEDAINSLIGGDTSLGHVPPQTFQGFEVVIVDDASTDNTPEMCERIADDWKGIRYLRHDTNQGSAAAMNTGIQSCRSHFIAAMDSDDMMHHERLRTMLRCAEQHPGKTVYDSVVYFGNGEFGIWNGSRVVKYKWLPEEYDYDRVVEKNTIHKGVLFPKKAWEEAGGYPEIMDNGREDWAFNVGLGRAGWCGVHAREADGSRYAGYYYRREGQNRTLTNTTPAARGVFREKIASVYPDIFRGERPMGCCGGGRPPAVKKKVNSVSTSTLPGERDGMILLEYNGGNWGTEVYIGEDTKTHYVFSRKDSIKYVDKNDAGDQYKGLLSLRENGKRVFKTYTPPEPKEEETVVFAEENFVEVDPDSNEDVDGQIDDVALENEPKTDEQSVIIPETLPDVNEMNVSDIKGNINLDTYSVEEIQLMLDDERAGKDRITAITHLQGLVNAVD